MLIEFPELTEDEVFTNRVDIDFYTNQIFEDWKKINNLAKKSEIVGTLLGVMKTDEKPYFHIEWIMDNIFKLTPEEKAENERYWARDAGAAGASGEEGEGGEGGEDAGGDFGESGGDMGDIGGDDAGGDVGGDDAGGDAGGDDAGGEFEF